MYITSREGGNQLYILVLESSHLLKALGRSAKGSLIEGEEK